MYRREAVRAGVAAGGVAIGGCLGGSDTAAFRDGFEAGIGDWEGDAAIGPEVDIEEFEWELEVSDAEAAAGDRSLRIWNEGDYDDGVTWAVHPVSVASDGAHQVTASAQFWSESESFNTIRDAVMRLSPEPPETEEDFPHPGVNTTALGDTPYGGLREPLWLTGGWREYSFEWGEAARAITLLGEAPLLATYTGIRPRNRGGHSRFDGSPMTQFTTAT